MARTSANKLTMAQQFELIKYVQEHYESAGKYDPEFASQAEQALGFVVTAGNIQGVREQFNIQSTLARQRAETPELVIKRIEKLEQQVAKLTQALEQLAGPL